MNNFENKLSQKIKQIKNQYRDVKLIKKKH